MHTELVIVLCWPKVGKHLNNVLVEIIASGIDKVFKLKRQYSTQHRELIHHHIVIRWSLKGRDTSHGTTQENVRAQREILHLPHLSFTDIANRLKEISP